MNRFRKKDQFRIEKSWIFMACHPIPQQTITRKSIVKRQQMGKTTERRMGKNESDILAPEIWGWMKLLFKDTAATTSKTKSASSVSLIWRK